MAPETVQKLVASRWFVPAMAVLHEEQGVRVATLVQRLKTSRSMGRRVLDQLMHLGWIGPNPGHGHPLRPEFMLSSAGEPIGRWCSAVMATREKLGLEPGDLNRWSLPILCRLERRPHHFAELERALSPVTPRALSISLKQLIGNDLVARNLENGFPPTAIYGATRRGEMLAKAAA